MKPLLEVTDFQLTGSSGLKLTLPQLRLRSGEVAALQGPSGCGKTSTLLALFGLHDRTAFAARGRVLLAGSEFPALDGPARQRCLQQQLCFSLQDAPAALDPLAPVGAQIQLATGCDREAAVAALREMGVAEAAALCQRLPHQISGGEAQRVLLAIAWLRRPALLVADEPSASLDGGNVDELVRRLRHLQQHTGTALLLATHDHRLLERLDASVLVLRGTAFAPGKIDKPAWQPRPRGEPSHLVLLRAEGVELRHGRRRIVRDASFELRRGEVVALVGDSGAGKTTLARALCGHHAPHQGRIVRPPRRQAVQLLFQDALASMTPGRTVRSLVREVQSPFFDLAANAAQLGLGGGELDREAAALSGGERRRAALLRALSVNPEVLVLDEPTASLDRVAAAAVIDLLLAVQQQRSLALVLVTHDLELATAVADSVLRIDGGRLCAA